MDPAESVSVYELVPVDTLVEQAGAIAKALFSMSSVRDGDREVTVSPVSGVVRYLDASRLWRGEGDMPNDPDRAARTWLQEAAGRVPSELGTFLPRQADIVLSQPVPAPDGTTADHWLIRFQPTLAPGGLEAAKGDPRHDPEDEPGARPSVAGRPAPALGGSVDLRLGSNGEPIAMTSNWRPWRRRSIVRRLPPPTDVSGGGHSHGGEGETDAPTLVYLVAAENEPQTYVAPYWIETGDHGMTLAPASDHSPMVQVDTQASTNGVTLTAHVTGTLGSLRYAWGATRLDTGEQFTTLGTSSSIKLGPGAHDVVVDVADTVTRAVGRRSVVIYAGEGGR